jgi:hypothetical protein
MVAIVQDVISRAAPRGDGVHEGYRHYAKVITPRDGIYLPECRLKWYDIGYKEFPVSSDLHADAREVVIEAVSSAAPGTFGDVGFVVLHDCGEIVFLMLGTWRGNNELWQTIFEHRPEEAAGFTLQRIGGNHRPSACVWELGAISHEAQAWARYLSTGRTPADLEAYLADYYAGEI